MAGQGAVISEITPELPDVSQLFAKLWGVALAKAVGAVPEDQRGLMEPGLLAVAERFQNVSGLELLEAQAVRIQAAHEMAALQVDAILSPCVPHSAPLAEADMPDAVAALVQNWAPWTVLFSLTRQPALSLPMGVDAVGLPTAVQIAAPLYRDDIVLRVARAVELGLG